MRAGCRTEGGGTNVPVRDGSVTNQATAKLPRDGAASSAVQQVRQSSAAAVLTEAGQQSSVAASRVNVQDPHSVPSTLRHTWPG